MNQNEKIHLKQIDKMIPTQPYYEDKQGVLYHGDCLNIMPEIPDRSVDMILCDLPYGTTACSWDEIIPLDKLWEQYYRIIRPNGFIVLFGSQPFTSKLVMSNINNFSHQWIWEKIGSNGNPLLANKTPLKNFEDILVFSKKGYDEGLEHPLRYYTILLREYTKYSRQGWRRIFGNYQFQHFMELQQQYTLCTKETYDELTEYFGLRNMEGFLEYSELEKVEFGLPKRVYNPQFTEGKPYTIISGKMGEAFGSKNGEYLTDSTGERYPKSILRFGYCKEKLHPTQKPVALCEYLIKTYTNENELILDNCSGSGTTGMACLKTNRKFIMIEKELEYCEIVVERLKNNVQEYLEFT